MMKLKLKLAKFEKSELKTRVLKYPIINIMLSRIHFDWTHIRMHTKHAIFEMYL